MLIADGLANRTRLHIIKIKESGVYETRAGLKAQIVEMPKGIHSKIVNEFRKNFFLYESCAAFNELPFDISEKVFDKQNFKLALDKYLTKVTLNVEGIQPQKHSLVNLIKSYNSSLTKAFYRQ